MGIGQYNRGSASISRQLCREYGCSGCSACHEHVPTPRPEGWGDKTKAKAQAKATRLLAYFRSRGTEVDATDIAEMLIRELKCGKKTAREAAEFAFAETA